MQRTFLMLAVVAGWSASAQGAEPAPAVAEAREAITRWVEVEDTISAERAAWAAEQATMAELLELHRKELALLDEELAKAGASAGSHDATMTEARAELARLRTAREQVAAALATTVPRLRELVRRFPQPLRDEARDDLTALDAWKPDAEPRDGLRAVIGVLARADAFNRRLTRTREVRDDAEVEVLYLGLARAYYVGGNTAGIGTPGPNGWEWRADPALAAELRKGLAMLEKRRPPAELKLPMAVDGGEGVR